MTQHMRFAMSLIAACGTAAVVSAQPPSQPQTPPRPSSPTTQQPTTRSDAQTTGMTTVSGCLKMEKDVPGMKPNVAERAGVGEDIFLTNARMAMGSGSGSSATGSGATGSGSAAGSGAMAGAGRTAASAMYKITGLSGDELKKHLNHQVELQGRVDEGMMGRSGSSTGTGTTGTGTGTGATGTGATGTGSGAGAGSTAGRGMGDDTQPKEFRATSLKMIAATCSAGTN